MISEWLLRDQSVDWPIEASALIVAVVGWYLAASVLAFVFWQATGSLSAVVEFFQAPAALLMVCLAAAEFWLSLVAIQYFAADDLLRPGWTLIACSAGCQLAGSVCSQILGVSSQLNPLRLLFNSSEPLITLMRQAGLLLGGTFRFALLAAGLSFVLKAYRRAGLPGRLGFVDFAVLAAFAVYLGRNVLDVAQAFQSGKPMDAWEVLGWPVDPLLLVLLLQGLLLFRSSRQMGTGRIGRCWKVLSIGIFLTALGDVGMWATNYGYLPWPWSSVTWYLWLPAAAAFARAPAFQLEVILDASREPGPVNSGALNLSEP